MKLLSTFLLLACAVSIATAETHRALISEIGSERATSGNGNKIVTFDGKTHIVWQDSIDEGYFARVRTLRNASGEWSPIYTLGKGRDNHARPTITVDSKGYLHVIIGGHHSGLQYRRSVRPNDASEWTPVEAFGKTTYPLLICGPDDTLYLTGRHDAGWKGIDFYARPPGKKWQHRGLLVTKQKRYLSPGLSASSRYAGISCSAETLKSSTAPFAPKNAFLAKVSSMRDVRKILKS